MITGTRYSIAYCSPDGQVIVAHRTPQANTDLILIALTDLADLEADAALGRAVRERAHEILAAADRIDIS